MAGRLIGPWDPAIDSVGKPLSGAKLYTFDSVATTTPKGTYTTSALTTPLANPAEAGSDGRFPQIWAAEGAGFYLVLKTAAGVIVDDWEDIAALGTDATGAIVRNEGPDGKLQIYADAGVANFEGGDPDPDNVGGQVRIGGWAGTQADSIQLDAAAVMVSGTLEVAGSPLGAIASGTFAAQATGDITLPAGHKRYRVELRNIVPSVDASFNLRTKQSGDSDFRTGASAYAYNNIVVTSAAAVSAGSTSSIPMSPNNLEATGALALAYCATIKINSPVSPEANGTRVLFEGEWLNSSGTEESVSGTARVVSATTALVALRFYFNSGTISFNYEVFAE